MAGASPEMGNPRFRPPKNERDSRGDGEVYCGLAGALFATLEVSERGQPRGMARESFGEIQTRCCDETRRFSWCIDGKGVCGQS